MALHPRSILEDPVTLEWGKQHSLQIEERPNGVWLILLVSKTRLVQPIEIKVPIGITIKTIVDAWEAQGSQWDELTKHDGVIFIASRVIWFPVTGSIGCLQWSVLHVDGFPSDTLGFTPLTREIWEAAKAKQEIC